MAAGAGIPWCKVRTGKKVGFYSEDRGEDGAVWQHGGLVGSYEACFTLAGLEFDDSGKCVVGRIVRSLIQSDASCEILVHVQAYQASAPYEMTAVVSLSEAERHAFKKSPSSIVPYSTYSSRSGMRSFQA